jgi:xanthine dehydrogenase accessory factor
MPDRVESIRRALRWLESGRRVAQAIVIQTWGSSPCPPGARLVVNEEGEFEGSVSGGCVEGEVIEAALSAIREGVPRHLIIGVSDDQVWNVGLACGGEVSIFVARVDDPDTLKDIVKHFEMRTTSFVSLALDTGRMTLIDGGGRNGGEATRTGLGDRIRLEVIAGTSRGQLVERFTPPARLIIVGAVHIAQHLAPIARQAGYAVTIIDPREAFASSNRFPDVTIVDDWPDQALEHMRLDRETAVIALAHDPKIDDPALISAVRSPAFYVGALGSRPTLAKRISRLAEAGLSDDEIARIRGPVGLAIGALTPSEIAISIMAEATSLLRADRIAASQQ